MGRKLDSSFDKVDQSYFMNYSNTYSFFKKFNSITARVIPTFKKAQCVCSDKIEFGSDPYNY